MFFKAEESNKRDVVLLDYDSTKFIDNSGESCFNDKLIQAFKETGIKDIFLFTRRFLFEASYVEEIKKVILYLRKCNFTVHGVITPSDLVWQDLPETSSKLWLNFKAVQDTPSTCMLTDYDKKLDYHSITKILEEEHNKSICSQLDFRNVACTFEEASEFCSAGHFNITNIKEKIVCAVIVAVGLYAFNNSNYLYFKEFMLKLFLLNKPNWVGKTIIVDNHQAAHQYISNYIKMNDVSDVYVLPFKKHTKECWKNELAKIDLLDKSRIIKKKQLKHQQQVVGLSELIRPGVMANFVAAVWVILVVLLVMKKNNVSITSDQDNLGGNAALDQNTSEPTSSGLSFRW